MVAQHICFMQRKKNIEKTRIVSESIRVKHQIALLTKHIHNYTYTMTLLYTEIISNIFYNIYIQSIVYTLQCIYCSFMFIVYKMEWLT